MAGKPKIEDFPTTTEWVEALAKWGANKRTIQPDKKAHDLKDKKVYDSSTQYSRFRTGPPVNPVRDDPAWSEYSKEEQNKKWKQYRLDMKSWKKIQRDAGTAKQKDKYGYSLEDRAEEGNLLGNLTDEQLARRLAQSEVKGRHRVKVEFNKRTKAMDRDRLYKLLEAEKKKEAERDKSGDIVLRKSGGKVYGTPTRKSQYKAG